MSATVEGNSNNEVLVEASMELTLDLVDIVVDILEGDSLNEDPVEASMELPLEVEGNAIDSMDE